MLNRKDIEKGLENAGFTGISVLEISRIGWVQENMIAADVLVVDQSTGEDPDWGTLYIDIEGAGKSFDPECDYFTADFSGAGLDRWTQKEWEFNRR